MPQSGFLFSIDVYRRKNGQIYVELQPQGFQADSQEMLFAIHAIGAMNTDLLRQILVNTGAVVEHFENEE